MISTLLFDVDGVVVNKPFLFSKKYSAEFNISPAIITKFFDTDFQPCEVGKADLREVLIPYLKEWGWKKSADDFLLYWFKAEHYVDERLLADINKLRASGVLCYLQTTQEKYRAAYLWNDMNLRNSFDGMFCSADLGVKKPNVQFWELIYKAIQPVEKHNILLWDDKVNIVESASVFGFKAELYESYSSYLKKMKQYGFSNH